MLRLCDKFSHKYFYLKRNMGSQGAALPMSLDKFFEALEKFKL